MKVYWNGMDLILAGIIAICGIFILITIALDAWCNAHMGHPVQKWLYRTLLKK